MTKFTVKPCSEKGFSLIQWDIDDHGTPRRSIQVETEIAHLWASAPDLQQALAVLLRNHELGEYESQQRGYPRMIAARAQARAALKGAQP